MTLSPNTKVTLGLIGAVLVPAALVIAFVLNLKGEVKTEIRETQVMVDKVTVEMHNEMAKVQEKLSAMLEDRYSLPMAEADALRQAIENPGHRVPDPRNPGQVIVVDVGGMYPDGSGPRKP